MAIRMRKVRRQRGSRTHGWGQIGQHRHSGSRGGTGMAGMHKHKWSYTVKYAPDHFGHDQFHPPVRIITNKWLNLGELQAIALKSGKQNGEVLDLGSLGYDKLLGQGKVEQALSVKVPRASARAVEKLKAAGGSIETEAKEPEEESKEKKKSSSNRKSGQAQ